MRWRHLGLTLRTKVLAMRWPDFLPEYLFLERISAISFTAEGIQFVEIFIPHSIMYRWVPWAHRSNGNVGHLAASNQAFAAVLSIWRQVILLEQCSANVSQVIRRAKNSATLIFMLSGQLSWREAYPLHSSQDICQKIPPIFPQFTLGLRNWRTPAIPKDVDASLERTQSLLGKRLSK